MPWLYASDPVARAQALDARDDRLPAMSGSRQKMLGSPPEFHELDEDINKLPVLAYHIAFEHRPGIGRDIEKRIVNRGAEFGQPGFELRKAVSDELGLFRSHWIPPRPKTAQLELATNR